MARQTKKTGDTRPFLSKLEHINKHDHGLYKVLSRSVVTGGETKLKMDNNCAGHYCPSRMREECVAPEEGVPCFPPIHLLGEKREVFEEDLRWEDSVPKYHRGGVHERSRREELLSKEGDHS